MREIWYELRGEAVYGVHDGAREDRKSIAKTKTFSQKTSDPAVLFSELSKNVERACMKARKHSLAARDISYFCKTTDFRYHGTETRLPQATAAPEDILKAIKRQWHEICRPGFVYRASGITLRSFCHAGEFQQDLFGAGETSRSLEKIHLAADQLAGKFGRNTVFLGSSFRALQRGGSLHQKIEERDKRRQFFRLPILYLGDVS